MNYNSPTEWKTVFSDGTLCLKDKNNWLIARFRTFEGIELDKANARRIIACTTALEGISTEALEKGYMSRMMSAYTDMAEFYSERDGGNAEEYWKIYAELTGDPLIEIQCPECKEKWEEPRISIEALQGNVGCMTCGHDFRVEESKT